MLKEHEIDMQNVREQNQLVVDELNAQLKSLEAQLQEQANRHELEMRKTENERIKVGWLKKYDFFQIIAGRYKNKNMKQVIRILVNLHKNL